SKSVPASAASPSRWSPAARSFAILACRDDTTSSTSCRPSIACTTRRQPTGSAIWRPPSASSPGRTSRLRPGRSTKNCKGSMTADAAGRNCSPTSCRLCWLAWGSEPYNRSSQGRAASPSRTGPARRERLPTPRGKPLKKHGALSDHQRLIRQCGVTPLMYQYGETVIAPRERQAREPDPLSLTAPKKAVFARAVETTFLAVCPNSYMAVFFAPFCISSKQSLVASSPNYAASCTWVSSKGRQGLRLARTHDSERVGSCAALLER